MSSPSRFVPTSTHWGNFTITELSDSDVNQAVIKRALGDATGKLAQATEWLLQNYRDDPDAPGSIALNFLMLMGYVCGGWQMARATLIATEKSASSSDDFYRSKIVTARFYAEHYLPRTSGYFSTIRAGSESIMALDAEQF